MTPVPGAGASANMGGVSSQITQQFGKLFDLAKNFIGAMQGLAEAATPVANKLAELVMSATGGNR